MKTIITFVLVILGLIFAFVVAPPLVHPELKHAYGSIGMDALVVGGIGVCGSIVVTAVVWVALFGGFRHALSNRPAGFIRAEKQTPAIHMNPGGYSKEEVELAKKYLRGNVSLQRQLFVLARFPDQNWKDAVKRAVYDIRMSERIRR